MAQFLGVDCGGTNLRVVVVDREGRVFYQNQVASPLKHQPEKLANKVYDLTFGQAFEAIGVGVPGPLDLEKGLILKSANLGNLAPINIRQKFESLFNIKIYLDRDTNVALLGEAWLGAAKGVNNAIMLTLGSGVGGAIMVDGHIDRGEDGHAGELGHMYLEISNFKFQISNLPKCGLGHEGCLEAMVNSAKDLDELSVYLGYGLANLVDIFNPEKIIIGGGKLYLGDFLPKAVEVMEEVGIKPAVDEVLVEYAKLKEWSGSFGAAWLAMQNG